MYYLTVGYPLGMEIVEERQVYQIFHKHRIFNLIPLEYRIWSKFLLGAQEADVKKVLPEADLRGYDTTMLKLVQTKMLVAIPEDGRGTFGAVTFLRQGIGVGLDLDKNTYSILFREKIEVTSFEYNIWKEADGEIPYDTLEKNLLFKHQGSSHEIQQTVLNLCRRGLILAVSCEER